METVSTLIEEEVAISKLTVNAYSFPTQQPESDGTLEWDSTTLVLVELHAGGEVGIGYTYADEATAVFIDKTLRENILGATAIDPPGLSLRLKVSVRNQGNAGIAAMAISAVDAALWDLKGKLLNVPVAILLGKVRDDLPVYGSGGFTSYTRQELQHQLHNWVDDGFTSVKMKIGREPSEDVDRVRAAREAIGDTCELFVDANGAYTVRQSLDLAYQFAKHKITWLEEPVSSDNLDGLHFIREHAPLPISIAAGEYGYDLSYFQRMLHNKVVDVLQADATRCGGITEYIKAGYLCEAYHVPFSSHCAPALHQQASLALPSFVIGEYFHDHVNIEKMVFDGSLNLSKGRLTPDLSRPGLGLEFKHADAEKFKCR